MSSWQTVYRTTIPHQAEIVKDVLNNEGFAAIVLNLQDHAYKFGQLEVKVNPDSVIRALKIINEQISFNNE
ncbi:hypothetical protein [Roseivirga sp.]|uniref:hypothetical protein n=1 Tax=Roseivirga sp. TaxID=1964215 RepID=UPI003B51B84E